MRTQRVKTKELLSWLVRWTRHAGNFYLALAALISSVTNIIFLTAHFVTLLLPIAQQPGPSVVLGRLSLSCWSKHIFSGIIRPMADVPRPRP
jgi:hypothetical protein